MVQRLGRGKVEMHVSPLPCAGSRERALAATSYHSLADWRASAGGRLSAAAQPSPYDRFEWFERTVRLAGTVRRPLVLAADAGEGAAWLPLDRIGRGRARALASWYTLAYRPVFGGLDTDGSLAGLPLAARRAGLARLTLEPVPEWDGTAARLAAAFRATGWCATVREKTGNWVHRVEHQEGSEYLASRPGRLRSTLRRKGRQAGLSTHLHRTVDDTMWAAYADVFADSWKGEEGSLPFLRDLAEAAARDGTLRLGFARMEGRAVATQLWTVEDGCATIHKLAYREDARELSAGTVLSAAMFAAAIDEDRVQRIDYGTGDDAYKRDWTGERRRLMTVTLTDPRSPIGLAWLARGGLARLVADRRGR